MSHASILILQGVDQGTRFEVADGAAAGIGRGAKNDIRILDTEVSRQHATLESADGRWVVSDRDSSNGTFVNGQPVRSRQLKDGDQIQIGRSVLLIHVADENESEWAGDLVDLVGRQESDDRSSIVAEVSHEVDRELLDRSADAGTQELAQTLANLQVLYRITDEAVSPSISLEQLLQRILDLTIQVVGADRGCMLLDDPETGEIAPHVFTRRRGVDADKKMPVSRSIVDYVLQAGQGVRTSDARRDRRFEPGQSILQAGIREAMCVPMQGRYELRGVVYVDTTTSPARAALDGTDAADKFSDEQLRLLVAIGRQAALAIENNRYQQALLKAERLATMGQTIATLSHHIKNILQGVRGGSYLIDMGLKDHDEGLVRKGWGIVEKNQNKIYHLVMDMLTFSKERQPALEKAQLNETVAEVYELMQSRAAETNIALEFLPAADMPPVVCDPEGIYRAVLNVVTNAIDATEGRDSASVRIETGYDGEADSVFVCVTDNGSGIPEDQLKKIFNAFESTKGSRGTGLGLAVSRKILREHGGDITVETEAGRGSQFILTWPSIEEEPVSDGRGMPTINN